MAPSENPQDEDRQAELERALAELQKQISAGDIPGAIPRLRELLETHEEQSETLYMLAVCYRYTGNFGAATETLGRLKYRFPGHSRAHQEEGHLHRDQGRPELALECYRRATRLNPSLHASLKGQLEILHGAGRTGDALNVQAQIEWLQSLPPPLVAATDLVAQGKLGKAEDLVRKFLRVNKDHVEGMRLLADIGSRLGVLEDAEFLLESAVVFQPDNVRARMDYVQVLRKRQKFERARDEAGQLLESNPENPQFRSLYAIESMQTGDYDRALELFDEVLARVPGDPNTLTSKGHALKTQGRAGEAIESYRAALQNQPTHGEAYYSLANLKTYSFQPAEVAAMRELEDNPNLDLMDRVHLFFALGKAFEDGGEFGTSFGYYERGNEMKKLQSRYSAEQMHDELTTVSRTFTEALLEQFAGSGDAAPDPIFIVGLPRAGSTLLEQILSSHSQVDGTLELPNILSLSQRLRRRKTADGRNTYPEAPELLEHEELAQFGAEFLRDTRIHRQSAPRFIDKMPNNFRHVGLIRLILPNAKIIDARRAPMACCFSGFKQLFAEGQEFTYGLHEVGRYYRDYVDLMAHWDTVLPGHVLRVQHEDVVDDLESEVRRILDFCELPFEDACLRYWETERNVRTPSSEQVRQPIFRESVEQWRNYEPWLGPLKDALGPLAES